ncbi:cytochrome c3 family protein [Bacteroidota bacterium]
MKKYLMIVIILIGLSTIPLLSQSNHWQTVSSEDQCIICHQEMELLPEQFSEADIHLQIGLSCAGCHGGDPTTDDMQIGMSSLKGFVGVPGKKDIPQFCGKCHSNIEKMRVFRPRIATDQVSQYYKSVHGIMLKKGNNNVADCISCHTAHSIFPAKDPRSTVYAMNVSETCNICHGDKELIDDYGLSGNELEEYTLGVHGIALFENKDASAPTCNDCHGNHGATPPGLTSISHVCGTCHINNAEYFNSTRMAGAFKEMDFHGCEQCHSHHLIEKTNDEMIGVGEKSLCIDCHEEGDEGYVFAVEIKSNLDDMVAHYDSAQTKLREVETKGMNEIDIDFLLMEAKQDLIQSRTLVHTFDSAKVNTKTTEGLAKTKKAILLADKEIEEYFSRRNGFAVATLIFMIFIIALYFKLKDISKNRS